MIQSLLPLLALSALAARVFAQNGFLGGVNLAGLEFGVNVQGGIDQGGKVSELARICWSVAYARIQAQPIPEDQIEHFAKQGVNIFRIPLYGICLTHHIVEAC